MNLMYENLNREKNNMHLLKEKKKKKKREDTLISFNTSQEEKFNFSQNTFPKN